MFGIIRFVLALVVVVNHHAGVPGGGRLAVFGFYCLSGYLMTLILRETYGLSGGGISRYLANRALRIFPLYWLAFAVFAPALYFAGIGMLPTTATDWLRNIALFDMDFLFKSRAISPAWSLYVELFYYALIPLILLGGRLLVLATLGVAAGFQFNAVLAGADWDFRYGTVMAAALPFLCGIAIYEFRVPNVSPWWPLSALAAIYIAIPFAAGSPIGTVGLFYASIPFTAALIASAHGWLAGSFIRSVDRELGQLSYPLYLVHFPIGLLVAHYVIGDDAQSWSLLAVAAPISVLVAWLLAHSVEAVIDRLRDRVRHAPSRLLHQSTSTAGDA